MFTPPCYYLRRSCLCFLRKICLKSLHTEILPVFYYYLCLARLDVKPADTRISHFPLNVHSFSLYVAVNFVHLAAYVVIF